MLSVSGNTIEMINGDSETILIAFTENGAPAALVPGDTVYFTVKKYLNDDENTLQKIATEFVDGKASMEIKPIDTINMKGSYFYDVQLNRADGTVTTIVKPSQFIINKGVTT